MTSNTNTKQGPFYIWHDYGCCDNVAETLEEARQIKVELIKDMSKDGGEIDSVYITDADGRFIDDDVIIMRCADEDMEEHEFAFLNDGSGDFVCKHCGWLQSSEAGGAAEMCEHANWSDIDSYHRYAKIAIAGGHQVPDTPKKRA